MLHRFLLLLTEEDGADSIEYAILATLVSVALILAVATIGNSLVSILDVAVAGLNGS